MNKIIYNIMIHIMNGGGQCFSKTLSNKLSETNENYKKHNSCFSNIELRYGIKTLESLFNGVFEKELLSENLSYTKRNNEKVVIGKDFVFDSYRVMKTDLEKKEDRLKFQKNRKKLINSTREFIKKQLNDKSYYIVYSLNLIDVEYSKKDVLEIKEMLKKYFNLDRFIFIGAICGDKWPYNTHNPYFKEVFGDNYILINTYKNRDKRFPIFKEEFEKIIEKNNN